MTRMSGHLVTEQLADGRTRRYFTHDLSITGPASWDATVEPVDIVPLADLRPGDRFTVDPTSDRVITVTTAPTVADPIPGIATHGEGRSAIFEARTSPDGDPQLLCGPAMMTVYRRT